MSWFNIYGAAFVFLLLLPNVIFAATHKDGFENLYQNKKSGNFRANRAFWQFHFHVCLPAFSLPRLLVLCGKNCLCDCRRGAHIAVFAGLDCILEGGLREKGACTVNIALNFVFGKRNPHLEFFADCGGGNICAVPHFNQLQKRKDESRRKF